MKLRAFFVSAMPLVTVAIVALAAFFIIAPPTATTYACNPCQCPEDRRMNCQGIQYYGVYTYNRGGVCYLDAYRMKDDGSPGRRVWRVTSRDLTRVPELPERNTLITEGDGIALYRLTSGELQVNAGPAGDGKVYVMVFNGCGDAAERRESTFVPGT
jgi:hypothetical protein